MKPMQQVRLNLLIHALMYLMYGMFAVTVIVTLIGAIAQFGGALKDNPKGAIKSLLGIDSVNRSVGCNL